ncbi:MAG: Maf family protein, partial [Deltaproteobacteria bacterium]
MKLILASASPRRKVLLKELFPDFEVRPADIEEVALPGETPLQSAERLAMEKALKVRETWKEGFILAADTLVTINGLVFGKPKDPIEAE